MYPSLPATGSARFLHGNTQFTEEFRIRGNEAGPDQRTNIIGIANLLQEVGGNHGVALWGRAENGFAAMPGMDHLIFVATRMQIRMDAYPKWGDLVRLDTYFSEDGRLTVRRDWRIIDVATGQQLGAATSTWVTINSLTRRLAKLPDGVRQRFLTLSSNESVLPVKDTRRKLPEFEFPAAYEGPVQVGRRSDMDPNGHINNVCYLAWAMEAVPEEIYQDYHLKEVEMDFKAECTAGDEVECLGMPLSDGPSSSSSGGQYQYLHLLRKRGADGPQEVWRARTTWVPKVSLPSPEELLAAQLKATSNGNGNGKSHTNGISHVNGHVAVNGHVNGSSLKQQQKPRAVSEAAAPVATTAAPQQSSESMPGWFRAVWDWPLNQK